MKHRTLLIIAGVFSLALGFSLTMWLRLNSPIVAHTNWASSAARVEDVAHEADAIVRVQVQKVPKARKLKEVDHVEVTVHGGANHR